MMQRDAQCGTMLRVAQKKPNEPTQLMLGAAVLTLQVVYVWPQAYPSPVAVIVCGVPWQIH
jgi:hypothetical protein